MYAFSLYKARKVPTKSPVCAICVDRTRGTTHQVRFGYGVSVWLCQTHASVEFLTGRSGRDLVVTLMGIWRANGCRIGRIALLVHDGAMSGFNGIVEGIFGDINIGRLGRQARLNQDKP